MYPCSSLIKHYLFEVPVCVALAELCLLEQNKASHFVIFLATGVAGYLHNSDRKITLQKHRKHEPSKGEGKTATPLHSVTEKKREWREGKTAFACLTHVTKENSPRLPRFFLRTHEEYPVWP